MTKEERDLVDVFMRAQAEPEGRPFSENVLAGIKAVQACVMPANVDGQNFYELCQAYRWAKDGVSVHGMPTSAEAFNHLREYVKTGKLPWPSYERDDGDQER